LPFLRSDALSKIGWGFLSEHLFLLVNDIFPLDQFWHIAGISTNLTSQLFN
jgi:hypothetical protein